MSIEAYLFFNGRCEEAIALYQEVMGAQVEMLMRFNECPDPLPPDAIPPGHEEKVMHASLRIGGTRLMLSDGNCAGATKFDGFSLSLALTDSTAANRVFTALATDGTITMPIGETFWSPCFGMVTDKFGVPWMVTIEEAS